MKAEIYKREDKRWDFRILADNGEIIATSGGQAFNERNDAFEAVNRLAEGLMDAEFMVAYLEDTGE